jgi:hypothetical protein
VRLLFWDSSAFWDDLPPAGHTGASARDAAKQVLARPEFHRPGPSIIQRIERWISEAISRALDAISGVAGGGFVASLILIAAVALVVVMLLRFGKGVQRDAPRPAARVRTGRGRSADDWRAEAAQHEAAGKWRDALRCRYRALVAELAGNGLLDDIPGKTTGEERADIARAAPDASPPFTEATALFDDVWYADAPTGAAENERLRSLSDAVLEKAAP